MERIHHLPRAQQRFVMQVIDTVLAQQDRRDEAIAAMLSAIRRLMNPPPPSGAASALPLILQDEQS